MAQNRDRIWQDRDQHQGGQGHRGSWQGGEDYGQGERGQHQGSEDQQSRGSWGEGRESYGGWQSGGQGQQPGGEWSRMGRYGEEGWQGGQGSQGGGMGRWGQGGNYRMDRDYGQSGSRGGFGGGSFGGGYEGQGIGRPYVGESIYGGSRGGYGGSSYGGSSYGSSGYGRGSSSSGGSYGQQQGERGFWDRASDEVSSWLGDDDARRRRERDEHRGRGPKGYTRSDERIREDVNDRLTDDGWLDASDIEVQVSSAEVTLTGHVNSREEKRRAEDIVEAVSGVKHVQNNLRVKDRMSASSQGSTTQFGSAGSGTSGTSQSGSSGSTGSKTGR
jgi:osmotically-inducible protein OsmY